VAPGGDGRLVTAANRDHTAWRAPAKLTLTLRVTGVRSDGYHLLESEMVTLDLSDTLEIDDAEPGHGELDIALDWPEGAEGWSDRGLGPDADNLVTRAAAATGRAARIRLVKRIPPGAGLGGGSADAAAVLRWAGCHDRDVAEALGADVPFCLIGGRARVSGIGEELVPLPFEDRSFVLLMPPFGVDTAAVYRAYDRLASEGKLPEAGTVTNELELPASVVEPRLAGWRRMLEEVTGLPARLAGSGSTWFVDGRAEDLGLADRRWLEFEGQRAPLVAARTSPAWGEVLQ
jgi:4-diphosphocytidyl-2-C-methyl-D-erythritol kinase